MPGSLSVRFLKVVDKLPGYVSTLEWEIPAFEQPDYHPKKASLQPLTDNRLQSPLRVHAARLFRHPSFKGIDEVAWN
jgi:hypothetical protein